MPAAAAYTSTRQIPAAYKEESLSHLFQDKNILDWGAGKYDDAKVWLRENLNCSCMPYDPYNLPAIHNLKVLEAITSCHVKVDTVTCLNVLNVLQDKHERADLLHEIYGITIQACSPPRHLVFQVYEGDRSGIPSSNGTTQNNQKLSWYLDEIKEVFPERSWTYTIHGSKRNIVSLTKKN